MGRNSRLPCAISVARTGSVRTVTAVDVEDVAGDERGFVRRDEDDRVGNLPTRPLGTPVTGAALFRRVPVKRVNRLVSVGPDATPFTRVPDLTISSAADLVMPSRRPAATPLASFLAKATAAALPTPVEAPVVNTTDLFIALVLMTDGVHLVYRLTCFHLSDCRFP